MKIYLKTKYMELDFILSKNCDCAVKQTIKKNVKR